MIKGRSMRKNSQGQEEIHSRQSSGHSLRSQSAGSSLSRNRFSIRSRSRPGSRTGNRTGNSLKLPDNSQIPEGKSLRHFH